MTNIPVRDCVSNNAENSTSDSNDPIHVYRRHPQHNGSNEQIIAAAWFGLQKPKAKRWMLGLARKMENEVEEHWYPCFYQRLRMEMAKYYETKKYLRMVEKSTDYEEDLYDEAV